MRSIMLEGISSMPYTPITEPNMGRPSMRICEYCPGIPLSRTWLKPQFWQSFSMRTPGAKEIPSLTVEALTELRSLGVMELMMEPVSRRVTARLSPVTTTASICM